MASKAVIKRACGHEDDDDCEENETNQYILAQMSEEDTLKEIIAASEKDANYDIFEMVGKRLSASDIYVKYAITRSGVLMGHRAHPYSWERLHEEFGGGHYLITARHPVKGYVIKKQTQVLAGDAKHPASPTPPPQPDSPFHQGQFMREPQPQTDPITGMAAMMGAILAPLTQLIGAVAQKPQNEGGENSITKVIEHVNRGQQMQFEMLSQMMKSSMEESKRSMEFQMKILEKVNAQIDASMSKGDRDKYSAADVLKATQDAQQAGFQLFAQMQTMASNIADEKMAALPASDGGKDTVTTLIEALAPLVLAGMTGGKGLPKQLAPGVDPSSHESPQAAQEPRLNFPRVELPDRSETQTHPNKMPPNPQNQRQNTIRPGGSAAHAPAVQVTPPQARPRPNMMGLSTVRFAPTPPVHTPEVMGASASAQAPQARTDAPSLLMTKYIPVLSPIFMGIMEKSGEGGNDVLTETLTALDRDGFDWRQFVQDVPTHHVVAAIQGLPEEYATLFRNFYGAAQVKARNASAAPTNHAESPAV